MHIFIWCSIASWFVVMPITSSTAFYSEFFRYVGVAYEVLASATFWFYWPLATVVALSPTVIFRFLRLELTPRLVDDVRLQMKKEGRKLFKRKTIKRKSVKRETTPTPKTKRSGYAFSHQKGFAHLIMSGFGFGMRQDNVEAERRERLSSWMPSATPSRTTSRGGTPVRSSATGNEFGYSSSGTEARVTERVVSAELHGSAAGPGSEKPTTIPGSVPTPTHIEKESEVPLQTNTDTPEDSLL